MVETEMDARSYDGMKSRALTPSTTSSNLGDARAEMDAETSSNLGDARAEIDAETSCFGCDVDGDISANDERPSSTPLTASMLEAVLASHVDQTSEGTSAEIADRKCALAGQRRRRKRTKGCKEELQKNAKESPKRIRRKGREGGTDGQLYSGTQSKPTTERQLDEHPEEPQKIREPPSPSTPSPPACVEVEIAQHNTELTRMSAKLLKGVSRSDPAAVRWAQLLEESVDLQRTSNQREVRLRALYSHLYGLGYNSKLPDCPYGTMVAAGAQLRIAKNLAQLRVTWEEALQQVDTQTHPGVFLLLTCHLGRERTRRRNFAFSDVPMVSLGSALLVLGLLWEHFTRDH
jgi:hypothetical protein